MVESPPSPVDVLRSCGVEVIRREDGEVLLMPVAWPVRLPTREARRAFAYALLALDDEPAA